MDYVFMTDSNSDLPYTIRDEHDIPVVFMPYVIDGVEYFADLGRGGENKGFYDKMRAGASPIFTISINGSLEIAMPCGWAFHSSRLRVKPPTQPPAAIASSMARPSQVATASANASRVSPLAPAWSASPRFATTCPTCAPWLRAICASSSSSKHAQSKR